MQSAVTESVTSDRIVRKTAIIRTALFSAVFSASRNFSRRMVLRLQLLKFSLAA